MDLLRANPGLIVALALPAGLVLALATVATLLRFAGASIRPVLFIAALTLPLSAVFAMAQLVRAEVPVPGESDPAVPGAEVGPASGTDPDWGPDVDPAMIHDARRVFPEVLGDATRADLALLGNGETLLFARFRDATGAREAAARYWKFFRIRNTSGDEKEGWRGRRGLNDDHFEMLLTGPVLQVWTALQPAACALRRRSAATPPRGDGTLSEAPALRPLFPRLQPLAAIFRPPGVRIALSALLVAGYVVVFFRGAAWAGSVPPKPGPGPVSSGELRERLLALNHTEAPVRVIPGAEPDELFAEWDSGDIRWVSHSAVHAQRRRFRIRIRLDAGAGAAIATDQFQMFDGSAGAGGLKTSWTSGIGIVFFQEERQTVLGFRQGPDGQLQGDPTHTFRFSLRELKSPLVDVVTRAGWVWRPQVWDGPRRLRWLTG